MRLILASGIFLALIASASAQELRCTTKAAEPYINRQLDAQFGQKLSDFDKLTLMGRGIEFQTKALWKSATTVSQQPGIVICSAVVQLTRPDTSDTFDVTVQYTLQQRDGNTYVKVQSAKR